MRLHIEAVAILQQIYEMHIKNFYGKKRVKNGKKGKKVKKKGKNWKKREKNGKKGKTRKHSHGE